MGNQHVIAVVENDLPLTAPGDDGQCDDRRLALPLETVLAAIRLCVGRL